MKKALKIIIAMLIIAIGAVALLIITNENIKKDISGIDLPIRIFGEQNADPSGPEEDTLYDQTDFLDTVPEWEGLPYTYINDNVPTFSSDEIWTRAQESLEPLDSLGRCGTAKACIGQETMPETSRSQISSIKPSGWHGSRYSFIEGGNLYNRCHLIGHQLTGDDAIDRNLITGTRYMNIEGMLSFENAIAKYVRETGNHVMYRVIPCFRSDELVARGVHLEAISVEDKGEGISFNVFCYNYQPGVDIDHRTGDNSASSDDELLKKYQEGRLSMKANASSEVDTEALYSLRENQSEVGSYIVNLNTGKFHLPECSSIQDMNEHNKHSEDTTREDLLIRGYQPCGNCRP